MPTELSPWTDFKTSILLKKGKCNPKKTFERENKKRKTKSKLFLQLVSKHCKLTYFNNTADLI